jgi:acyl phosphate:glycerol-3-phosphate acyltransferase
MWIQSILAIVIGYLLGSFPSAQIAARIVKKRSIRSIGAGNMGALNAIRGVGFVPGALVFIADVGKGALAVLVAKLLDVNVFIVYITAIASVAGHIWSVFMKFRGGRGAATSYGIFLALAPKPALIALGIILLVYVLTANAWLALGTAFVAQPFLIWLFRGTPSLIAFSIIVPVMLAARVLATGGASHLDVRTRKNLIVDHDFTWWGTKRKK